MAGAERLDRRAVLLGIAAASIAHPGWARIASAVPPAVLSRRTSLWPGADLSGLLGALRSHAGCLRVAVLRAPDGRVTLWQDWADPKAATAFWSDASAERHQILTRLEI
ncbi:hypothetical protein [Dinoroseobacter sp. S76]|uniref:hypothetical protein n=1 Tax=Dinoroseobacter sp. S76 TaxID=3415124 RepID=UPI003C7E1E6E